MTRVTVYSSAALLAFGTVTFFLLEYFNTLSHLNFVEALITSFFQSTTTRSSGFNTVDTSAISVPALLIMMMLMFIGASPGSMGGGIKTTTFTVIILSVWTTIVGKRNIEISGRICGFLRTVSLDRGGSGVARAVAKLFLDPQQLIVFRHAIRSGQRSGLDQARIEGHGNVRDRGVFGFTAAVAHHRSVSVAGGELHG